jgi:uncharacterized protein (DUF1800 family)
MTRRSALINRIYTLSLASLLTLSGPLGLAQQPGAKPGKNHTVSKGAAKGLTAEQKAIHLLNRITFGPRPGDVERVMKTGWEKFLDEQLHPERIPDQLVEQKLQTIPSVRMSAEEIASTYPPGVVINQALQARGIDAKALRAETKEQKAQKNAADRMDDQQPKPADQPATPEELARRRQEIRALMQEMGWKPQQEALWEAQQAKILRAVYSERQLQETLTDFWFNHFNVFAGKGPSRMFVMPYERDVIRPHVFGKFEDLLRATAQSPAMLFYLDNWQSMSPEAKPPGEFFRRGNNPNVIDRPIRRDQGFGGRGLGRLNRQINRPPDVQNQPQMDRRDAAQLQRRSRGINENYAREIMELHTLGVDGGYTQKDVQEVARCLTGWTIRQPYRGGGFYFARFMHDDGEKMVLGQKIPAGGGIKDGETVIRMLARHPSTAKFIATKLARRFVSDHPPQSLIDRTAQVFLKTDGDLREVTRSILTSPEFWSAESYRAKIRTPFEMTVGAVRALNAETDGAQPFHRWMAQMGEPLFMAQPPTGYKDEAELWVNTGALLQRMNFALALAGNRIPGARVNIQAINGMTATQPEKVVDQVIKMLLNGDVSPQTRATLGRQLADSQNPNTDLARIVGLVLGSPEFQRQ